MCTVVWDGWEVIGELYRCVDWVNFQLGFGTMGFMPRSACNGPEVVQT